MFAKTFRKPSFKSDLEIVSPPLTKNYPLIGTAFDYLMRFYLKNLNPQAIESTWVAEAAPILLQKNVLYFITKGHSLKNVVEMRERAESIIAEAKKVYSSYLETGNITDKLLESAIHLAQLDPIFRAGIVDPNMGEVNKSDVEDLRNLISAVDGELFQAEQVCVLNPTFGKGSRLVEGADCDVLIDDTLIDIKTTKTLSLRRSYFNQLIGYYILYTIGGIDNCPSSNIKNVGIYFARHSLLYTIPVASFTKTPNFLEFKKRFIEKAEEVFPLDVK